MQLNDEQQVVVSELLDFLESSDRVAIVEGKPGTGKTFCMQYIVKQYKKRVVFTAPTNKATKVLESILRKDEYTPDCCTIYRLLGLQLQNTGEVRPIKKKPGELKLDYYSLVVLDEGFMANSVLVKYLQEALEKNPSIKLIILGDSYQIPPVSEGDSQVTKLLDNPKRHYTLHKVMRHEGDILQVVDKVRNLIDRPLLMNLRFLNNFSDNIGDEFFNTRDVRYVTQKIFIEMFQEALSLAIDNNNLSNVKAIAWRNTTVDFLNARAREVIFPSTHDKKFWEIGDLITLSSPALDDENWPIANTDDMGQIVNIEESYKEIAEVDYKINLLQCVMEDNQKLTFEAIAPEDKEKWVAFLKKTFALAKTQQISWGVHWDCVNQIHYVKHAYAITSHKAQGSTYDYVFVNLNDILKNQNRKEALQCLNVAMSRAKKTLIIGR